MGETSFSSPRSPEEQPPTIKTPQISKTFLQLSLFLPEKKLFASIFETRLVRLLNYYQINEVHSPNVD